MFRKLKQKENTLKSEKCETEGENLTLDLLKKLFFARIGVYPPPTKKTKKLEIMKFFRGKFFSKL